MGHKAGCVGCQPTVPCATAGRLSVPFLPPASEAQKRLLPMPDQPARPPCALQVQKQVCGLHLLALPPPGHGNRKGGCSRQGGQQAHQRAGACNSSQQQGSAASLYFETCWTVGARREGQEMRRSVLLQHTGGPCPMTAAPELRQQAIALPQALTTGRQSGRQAVSKLRSKKKAVLGAGPRRAAADGGAVN